MTDQYGNYFCQKLIQCCSAEHRVFILKYINRDFSRISCNSSGTHALQSLIEIINLPEEEELLKLCVRSCVVSLSININGTHVVQKVVSCIKEQNREQINKIILDNFTKLIFDSNGICVLKKFINGNMSEDVKSLFLAKICESPLEIIQNPFGNYIVQYIIEEWGLNSCGDIVKIIIPNIISLSMQKFSSNVVEKIFDIADIILRKKMIKELFSTGKISSLLKNKYGNYVLQKAIQVMSTEEKVEIKQDLSKKVTFSSNKEKSRLSALIDII